MGVIGKYYFEHVKETDDAYVVLQAPVSGGLLTLQLIEGNQVKVYAPENTPKEVLDNAFFALQED